jgi:hypothetical protein
MFTNWNLLVPEKDLTAIPAPSVCRWREADRIAVDLCAGVVRLSSSPFLLMDFQPSCSVGGIMIGELEAALVPDRRARCNV